MSIKTHGIAHFSLPVSDMARSVAFYSDVLGLELMLDAGDLVFFRSGKDHVILSYVDDMPPKPATPPKNSQHVHHAFIVEGRDFESSVAHLKSKDVEIFDQDERPLGAVFAGRSAYFYDPDGNILEIIDLQSMAYRPIAARVGHG